MEQNPTVLPKKVWNLVRVAYFMMKKRVSKRKLLLEINMMIKRGKIAGKAIFHHHHNNNNRPEALITTEHLSFTSSTESENEYSCCTSPATSQYSNTKLPSKDHLDMMAIEAVLKAMEMIQNDNSSPALPGFGNTPVVRQLIRVTDSPFPLNSSVDNDTHVDEAADQFISRFYNNLRQQNTTASSFDLL